MADPIPMVLPCPRCGVLHVDAADPEPECNCRVPQYEGAGQHAPTCSVFREVWTNPPHRSHLCHACGAIWRPADVETTGVAAVATRGAGDTWTPAARPFQWNADEALKLLDRDFRVVLFKDGLGSITALAVPKSKSLNAGVREWREFDEPEWETKEDMQRSIFVGPNKYSGVGFSVAEALHCLTEKAVFNRLPDGEGGFHVPPPEPKG